MKKISHSILNCCHDSFFDSGINGTGTDRWQNAKKQTVHGKWRNGGTKSGKSDGYCADGGICQIFDFPVPCRIYYEIFRHYHDFVD